MPKYVIVICPALLKSIICMIWEHLRVLFQRSEAINGGYETQKMTCKGHSLNGGCLFSKDMFQSPNPILSKYLKIRYSIQYNKIVQMHV